MAGVTSSIMLGLAAYQTYRSVTDKGPAAPVVPPPVADPTAGVSAASAAAVRARKRIAPTRSTLLTGPMGITTPAPVTRRTLLGG